MLIPPLADLHMIPWSASCHLMQLFDNEWAIRWVAWLWDCSVNSDLTWQSMSRSRAVCPCSQTSSYMCPGWNALSERVTVFHQADKCLYICLSVSLCDRVPQRRGLAARVWTLHALFILLTSDKAEALLVMMWILLPIMPRCRLDCKTARCILCVLQQLVAGAGLGSFKTLLFFSSRHRCWTSVMRH